MSFKQFERGVLIGHAQEKGQTGCFERGEK